VSKSALSALSLNLVKFLSPAGVRINAVEPGFVDTPWQKEKPLDRRAGIEAKIALGRFADPGEVADICLAVLKNTYLTGTVVPIGGGYGLA
jgi:3-oxoacyl-[acyl-carrier protein] reductase